MSTTNTERAPAAQLSNAPLGEVTMGEDTLRSSFIDACAFRSKRSGRH